MSRDWTPEELAIIATVPRTWIRKSKLTSEQVKEIRRRTDSLTVPWTLEQIAQDYGISTWQVTKIARRQQWKERVHEPEETGWWKEVEARERRARREARRAAE